MVEKPSGSDEIYIYSTRENSEDAGGAPGWSIIDQSKFSTDSGASFSNVVGGLTVQFAVKGALFKSSDATLSALALTDASTTPSPSTPLSRPTSSATPQP